MRVLHIANDFTGTKVHKNLYQRLDERGIVQTIFTTIPSNSNPGWNSFEAKNTNFVYANVKKSYHKFFFRLKIKTAYNYLIKHINLKDFDLIHATTLFSDGAIALKLFKDYKIPYIVAVRNSDINGFLAKAPHTWNIGRDILRNASAIVFISEALKRRTCSHIAVKGLLNQIDEKIVVQPNGIDDFWLNNIVNQKYPFKPRFCYVGRMDKNKNVPLLIDSIVSLKDKIEGLHFDIVGGGGEDESEVSLKSINHQSLINYLGPIYEKDRLQKVFADNNVFIMASHHETLGLVYVEALSQGLNIIYTKNEGVDGMFPKSVGLAVDSHSKKDICNAIMNISNHSENFVLPFIEFSSFDWNIITNNYISLYRKVLSE